MTATPSPSTTGIPIEPGMPICQADYPLDRYQEEFLPYAQEYLALPDRTPESVIPWMEHYIGPVLKERGDELLLLAHYYMGGEIVQLVERFGGRQRLRIVDAGDFFIDELPIAPLLQDKEHGIREAQKFRRRDIAEGIIACEEWHQGFFVLVIVNAHIG